jgi:hypothetical protein
VRRRKGCLSEPTDDGDDAARERLTLTPMDATFEQPLYAPDGTIEGALVSVGGHASQLVVGRGDDLAAAILGTAKAGQRVVVQAKLQGPSPKGPSEHPVYALEKVLTIDGAKPKRSPPPAPKAPYRGKVVRFNFARHGAKNGVVLDSGDFIHLKPEGFAKLRLKVGDQVAANGDAWPLVTGSGYVVEATLLNGQVLPAKPKG